MENSSEHQKYTGKAKTVETLSRDQVRIIFRDDITAGDGAKKDTMIGKGELGAGISNLLFKILADSGIPTHLINIESSTTVIARKLQIIPVEVVVRNIAAGSICRRYRLQEGKDLSSPLVEFFYKDDELHDPLIGIDTAVTLGFATKLELEMMKTRALQVNSILSELFKLGGMILVDFKLEFGKDETGYLFLADEISGDSMRVWDAKTRQKLDKDVFRKDLGDVLAGYRIMLEKLNAVKYTPKPQSLVAKIVIEPKKSVPNPSGDVVKGTLVKYGVPGIVGVTVGKTIHVELNKTVTADWWNKLNLVSEELLSNPLIESFDIEVNSA